MVTGVTLVGLSVDEAVLLPFVRPAFIFFAALGPLGWLERSITSIPDNKGGRENGWRPLGICYQREERGGCVSLSGLVRLL